MAALTTEQVLREEAKAIHGKDIPPGGNLYQELNKLDSAALCLSGGGIRSAAFALGVIQALAVHPRPVANGVVQEKETVGAAANSLLAKFQFLSTVSGGGYIGSWLSTWLARRNLAGQTDWTPVWQVLLGLRPVTGTEPQQLSWLRRYSNYLTPKLGITSADSWTALALILRNLILNWLIILPVLCAVLIVFKLFAIATVWMAQLNPQNAFDRWLFYILVPLGGGLLVYGLYSSTRNRPTSQLGNVDQGQFLDGGFSATCAAAWLLATSAALPYAQTAVKNFVSATEWHPFQFYAIMIAIAVLLYAIAWWLASPKRLYAEDNFWDFLAWLFAAAVFGAMIAAGLQLYNNYVFGRGIWLFEPSEILLVVCGLPWILLAVLLADMIFVGLTSALPDSDADREWLGRVAGWLLVIGLCWLGLMFLVFLGSKLAVNVFYKYWPWIAGGGSGLGGLAAWLAKSSVSPAKGPAKTKAALSANVVLTIAAPLFGVILIVLASAALDQILLGTTLVDEPLFKGAAPVSGLPVWPGGLWLPGAFLVLAGIAAGASYFININRFSLHALYRNRIIRGFLGASNDNRAPNRFTGFDEGDNLRMFDLWPKEVAKDQWPPTTTAQWHPYHIVNMALNVVATDNLAWQERKAEPFTASPLHTGGHGVGFRYSATYGDAEGISIGTAVAISGAAASPSMGYHSSPAMSFLMTMFNVRLGWWLGNPASDQKKQYGSDGPQWAITPLIYEMFGQTTDRWDHVYLSDGGHFENLGLYEMVRRRCRFIVVSDAGCDKEFQFEDLGNAIRKIAIDLNVSINFRGLSALRHRPRKNATYTALEPPFHAIGHIDYGPGCDPGVILYLKPCFHGNRIRNVGVRNYATLHPDFPHEGTGDQFFSESQFESYRALGFELTDSVLIQAFTSWTPPQNPTMEDFFNRLPQTAATGP